MSIYEGIDYETLNKDVIEFITSLAKDHFVVMGHSSEELNANDDNFTYAIDNPKTLAESYYQHTEESVPNNTQDFFLEEVQGRPLISSLQFELSS